MAMENQKAYIIGSLNKFIYFDRDKAFVQNSNDSNSLVLTSYEWSQISALHPEYIDCNYSNSNRLELKDITNKYYQKSQALEMSLELMDRNLSLEYKEGIAPILVNLLKSNSDLNTYVSNRPPSTPTPEPFDSDLAYSLLFPYSDVIANNYYRLKDKTKLFAAFYTLFKLSLNLEPETQDNVDQILTDSGNYSEFSRALYENSENRFDSATILTTKKLQDLKIAISPHLFNDIKNRLKEEFFIKFYDFQSQYFEVKTNNWQNEDDHDSIVELINRYFENREYEHNKKRLKRGNARRVKQYNIESDIIIATLKSWLKDRINHGDKSFLLKFQDLIKKQLLSSRPEHICKTCCDLAQDLINAGKFSLSEKLISYAKLFNSEDVVIYSQEAELLRKKGFLKEALEKYDYALSKTPDNEFALNGKAETLKQMRKYNEALEQYEFTLTKSPNNIVTLNGKAETLKEMGKYNEAIMQYDIALNNSPNNIFTLNGKAATFRDMGKLDKALKLYNNITIEFPSNAVAFNGKAETLRDMGMLEEALQQYEFSIEIFHDAFSFNGKAETLRDMGRFQEALELYKKIKTEFPYNRVAQTGFLKILFELDRLDELEQIVRKDTYITFDDFIDLHIYSMLLIKRGDWEDAEIKIQLGLNSPFKENISYFKTVYSYLKIIKKDYQTALSLLDLKTILNPVSKLLEVHALAASNKTNTAKNVLHTLDGYQKPVIRITLNYLSERYSLNSYKKTGMAQDSLDQLILDGELKALIRH